MVGGFGVDLDDLLDVVDRMASFERELERSLDDVRRRVDALHATWSGVAAAEQLAAHREWTAGAQRMHEAVGSMRRAAATAHGNYAAAVTANRGMWR